MTQEEKYMKEAIKQAKKAAAIGDVPIGCVIVEDDKIIARGSLAEKIAVGRSPSAIICFVMLYPDSAE